MCNRGKKIRPVFCHRSDVRLVYFWCAGCSTVNDNGDNAVSGVFWLRATVSKNNNECPLFFASKIFRVDAQNSSGKPFVFLPLFTFHRSIFSSSDQFVVRQLGSFIFFIFVPVCYAMDKYGFYNVYFFNVLSPQEFAFFYYFQISRQNICTVQFKLNEFLPPFFSQISFFPKVYLAFFFFFCLLQLPPFWLLFLVFTGFFCCSNWKYQKMWKILTKDEVSVNENFST